MLFENDSQLQVAVATPARPAAPRLSIADAPVGLAHEVRAVHARGATGDRLLEMGLTPGTRIHVVRRGLFGDPVQIEVRGCMLSMGREQARSVEVVSTPRHGSAARP